LLNEGGMQWAYSELFQNTTSGEMSFYLTHALRTSERHGTLVNYSETHDNARLAARGVGPHAPLTAEGRRWSLHRNRINALTSVCGGFGFTCGVEWCATEQVNVHSSRGLNWGHPVHLVEELARLNRLLAEHPCFFAGARTTRLDASDSRVIALRRDSQEGLDVCLVVVNGDFDRSATLRLTRADWESMGSPRVDLAEVNPDRAAITVVEQSDAVELGLGPGAVHCLAPARKPSGLSGELYRHIRARADWGLWAANAVSEVPVIPPGSWRDLAASVDADPVGYLARVMPGAGDYPAVVVWNAADVSRVVPVPPRHWLFISHEQRFRARMTPRDGGRWRVVESIVAGGLHVAAFPPEALPGPFQLRVEVPEAGRTLEGALLWLDEVPRMPHGISRPDFHGPLALLTNGRGGMARLGVDLGRITSKYDCLLGANLHPRVPVDRHVLAKRVRVWINADGFISPLNADNLVGFEAGPPAHWRFVANAGDGRSVEVRLLVDMLDGRNTVVMQFSSTAGAPAVGRPLPSGADVRLTVRVDLEDRNFHWETRRNGAAELHFESSCSALQGRPGFEFTPAPDRCLRAWVDAGVYHPQPEWSEGIGHPVEATRGMAGSGDAWSPGWFEIPLKPGATAHLTVCADAEDPTHAETDAFVGARLRSNAAAQERAGLPPTDAFGRQLVQAAQAFVVRRDDTRTVIAGYPWFLDWGRDSLIAARGLLAAGMVSEVRELLVTFARFEKDGTLPNSIHGEDASNRDTSDAPLWFGVVCEELAGHPGIDATTLYRTPVDARGRTLGDVLRSIAVGYLAGAPNGIRVDAESGLVWSPGHFTWMDTNHPAGTPREGYPVEIQALWIRLLRQLARIGATPWEGRGESWAVLAQRVEAAFEAGFWLEENGWFADCLLAGPGIPARGATASNALRSNALMPVALGIIEGIRARRTVEAVRQHLVVPGALRSLAPLPTQPPLPVRSADGRWLNDRDRHYWGHYEGDEDSRRKPAYHNGTAWTWTFPSFCEAVVRAYPGDAAAPSAARAYLVSMATLLGDGCVGQIPEVMDGDLPHRHRGCDAQAWGVTEALRVWMSLRV
jgi:predicted glycogen debranching enzyme